MDATATEEWKQMLKDYEKQKSNVQWEKPPPVTRVKHSDIRKMEIAYNPILQTYSDPNTESQIKNQEQERLIDTLAKNKDRALRYEQVYNVVNFENKLKGLEGAPNYPQEKPSVPKKFYSNYTNTNYNIISGMNFSDHHYLPPEKRPAKPHSAPKKYKINLAEFRDFDIINNRYKRNHEAKAKLDEDYYIQEAAEKYWKTHDYDPVVGEFVDEEKEKAYQRQQEQEAKVHGLDQVEKLPNGVKYSEGALYQPINMRVVDANRLYEIDMKNKMAKQRYETRYDVEKDYRERDIEESQRKEMLRLNRINPQKYLEPKERGYNILTNNPYYGRYAEKFHEPRVPTQSVWAKPSSSSSYASSRTIRSSGFQIAS
mgnify:FL=1